MAYQGAATPTIEEEDEDLTTTTESTMPQTTEIENRDQATDLGNTITEDEDPSSGTTETGDDCVLDPHDMMTSSYTEISFGSDSDDGTDLAPDLSHDLERDGRTPTAYGDSDSSSRVPGSMSLPQLSSSIVAWSETAKAEYDAVYSGIDALNPSSADSTRPNTAEMPSGLFASLTALELY